MADWKNKWLLSFNPDKCKVMHIGDSFIWRTMELPWNCLKLLKKDLGIYVGDNLKASALCTVFEGCKSSYGSITNG